MSKHFLRNAASLALLVLLGGAPALAQPTATERLHELFDARHDWEMREFPELAMRRGDHSSADRIVDESLAAIERRHERDLEDLERLRGIPSDRLGEDDLVSYEVFELRLRRGVDGHRYRMFLAPMGQRGGPHQRVAQMAENVRFAKSRDYRNYLARLALIPKSIDDAIERMRLGLAEGRTPPRIVLDGVPEQLDALLAEDGLAPLREPFAAMPSVLTAMEKQTFPRRFEIEALPPVRAALERLRTFFVEEYDPNCRETIAASDLPDGAAYYAHQLRTMTTTDMTPRQVHKLGLSEVARIRSEMIRVIHRSDFLEPYVDKTTMDDDELFAKFIAYLRSDPRFYHRTEEDLLRGYRDICKKVDAELPKYFGVLPRTPYGVKKIPDFMAPHQTTAYYSFGSLENGEPGWFYANTYALDQRPTYEMIALAMHEAVPGHHLQSSIAHELEDVPAFRRDTWFTAYGEGWALYSERLGIEMGLYEDPYDDFGRLLYEMWRACRLVVDPGLHALGWSRERAIAFMQDNTALSELNIVNEVDRYIAWPGQACAYKIGELEIRSLRREAEERLGRSFDIRAFHDVVLGAGSIPLDVLSRRVRDWIKSFPAGAAYD